MQAIKTDRWLIPVILFIFITVLLPGLEAHPDIHFWERWTLHTYHRGLKQAYLSGTNYPPLYQYVLWIYGKVQGSDEAIMNHIKYLRSLTLAFDFAALWFVYKWLNKKYDYQFILLTCILNIAFSYNSILWFQVDGIMSAFIIMACYFAWKQQIIISVVAMLLAVNFKLQAFIFIPLWGLLIIYSLFNDKSRWKQMLMAIPTAILLQYILIYPFIQSEESIKALKGVLFESVDRNPYLSWWAYNMWYWVADDPTKAPDNEISIIGISYKHLGMVLFFVSSFLALLPLFVTAIKKQGINYIQLLPVKQVWLGAAIISISFFFFNTQMHERYCHPAFLFIILYAYYYNDIFPLLLFSLAYFLNLEGVLHWLRLVNYETVIFTPGFIAAIHFICLLYLFMRLYTKKKETVATM